MSWVTPKRIAEADAHSLPERTRATGRTCSSDQSLLGDQYYSVVSDVIVFLFPSSIMIVHFYVPAHLVKEALPSASFWTSVVTGVSPSPLWYVSSFFYPAWGSAVPLFSFLCSSIFIEFRNSRSGTFGPVNFFIISQKESLAGLEPTASTSIKWPRGSPRTPAINSTGVYSVLRAYKTMRRVASTFHDHAGCRDYLSRDKRHQ